ncbi:hypothetical protein Hanom_Chr01g00029931 [Helianthus anomalus]
MITVGGHQIIGINWERHPGATIAFRPYNSSCSDSEHPGVDLTFALRSHTPVIIFKNYMI